MPHTACVAIAFVLALQTTAGPFVFGNAAARVSAEDLSAIARVVSEPIWLMQINSRVLRTGVQTWGIGAYLMPDRDTPELRQGRLMTLRNQGDRPDPSGWTPVPIQGQTTMTWVQVPLAGRLSTDVRNTSDPNWPITVTGQLSDTDVISLVQFVRSGPILASASRGGRAGVRLMPNRRISSIGVEGDGGSSPVRVMMTTETDCLDVLRLERLENGWSATYTGGACG